MQKARASRKRQRLMTVLNGRILDKKFSVCDCVVSELLVDIAGSQLVSQSVSETVSQ